MCSILLDDCMLLVIWIAMDWFLSSTLRLHSRITPTRPLTLTMFYIWLSFVGEFTFCGWGIRRLVGPDLHHRSPDAGG